MINPLAARELRTRFHSTRSNWFLTIWIVIAGLLGYLFYLFSRFYVSQMFGFGGGGALLASSFMGDLLFEMLIGLTLTGVLMVVPAVAAVSIVGERQRLTLDLLQVSQLGPFRLVTGKLVTSIAYVGLLVVAAAPVLTVPVLIGGVQVSDMFRGLGMIGLVAVMVASIAMWVSARARSLGGAIAATYLWVFVLTAGTGFLAIVELQPFSNNEMFPDGGREVVSLWANPYVALVSVIEEPLNPTEPNLAFFGQGTPFEPVKVLLVARQTGESFGFFEPQFFEDEFFGGGADAEPELPRPPMWFFSAASYVLIIALSLWRATRLLSVPNAPRRLVRKKPDKKGKKKVSEDA